MSVVFPGDYCGGWFSFRCDAVVASEVDGRRHDRHALVRVPNVWSARCRCQFAGGGVRLRQWRVLVESLVAVCAGGCSGGRVGWHGALPDVALPVACESSHPRAERRGGLEEPFFV